MVMETLQIRLTKGLIAEIQKLVDKDIYSSISEAVRDSVRRLVLGKEDKIVVPEAKEVQEKIKKEIKKQLQKPTGTIDFYPEEMATRKAIFRKFMAVAERYNFKQIETPAFENLSLLTQKEGEEIKQQIFTLEKRGEEEFGLRFDITVPAARMFIEKQKELSRPVKWFYLTRMWRYERPQQGRLREFYQFGTELFGSNKPEADAEVISLLIDSFRALGLTEKDFFVKVNNRKLLQGLLEGVIEKGDIFEIISVIDKKSKITDDEFDEELKRIKVNEENINKIKTIINIKDINEIKEYCNNDLSKEGLEELKSILNLLKGKKEFLRIDLSTARGLAYYTGIVFEAYDKNEKYRALAGGGRYDKLIEMFNGEPTPATGFGMGYATLSLLLKEKGLIPTIDSSPDYFIAIINDEVREKAIEIASNLRKKCKVEIDLMQRNLGNQFKFANKIGAKKVIIVGPDELKEGKVKVKDMETRKEEEVSLDNLFKNT
ncbi:MAG: histidine--tRNA ligase [Nanoarchaeota archaeon]|nr:histidine--tRNA ligase [Nanoarchaeota archaeon]MBU1004561.1 histidine--tRNA ligase [Nanoarchaeota archaeon]MBU1946584.1 histidine--tRNA ligase [Nanoarchaeota archaeon]